MYKIIKVAKEMETNRIDNPQKFWGLYLATLVMLPIPAEIIFAGEKFILVLWANSTLFFVGANVYSWISAFKKGEES